MTGQKESQTERKRDGERHSKKGQRPQEQWVGRGPKGKMRKQKVIKIAPSRGS